jgi:hypothetical protein
MHFFHFFFKSGWLAFIAIPHLFASKFLYEFKWNFVAGTVAMASVMLMFVIPPAIIFAPFALAFSSGAYALGTLHSMLLFMGIGSSHCEKAMIPEVVKVGMIQSVGYFSIWVITYGILLLFIGHEYLSVLLSDPETFATQEGARMDAGQWPAFAIAIAALIVLHTLWGSLVAVVMAAAGYGLGPKQESFNGLWGFGFRFFSILVTRVGWLLLMSTLILAVALAIFPEVSWDSVKHFVSTLMNGNREEIEALSIREPVLDSSAKKLIAVFLFVIWTRLPEAINAATACIAFRERLGIHEQEKLDAMPTTAEKQAKYETHAKEVASMRERRMPSRWQDTP